MRFEDIKKIGVVGARVMGSGITQVFARTGYPVILIDISDDILRKALEGIEKDPFGLMRLVEKEKLSEDKAREIMKRIYSSTDFNDIKDCDFVIEAVPEDPKLKKNIFRKVDSICKDECISSLQIHHRC